jgi:ATP-binding cassette subfamily B multidrug efflux pump
MAAATAMALRLNGISHWVMWEFAALFEHIGTVRDGMTILSRPHSVVDATDSKPLVVSIGEIRFEDVSFAYGGKTGGVAAAEQTGEPAKRVIDSLSLVIRPGENTGRPLGRGQIRIVNLLLRFRHQAAASPSTVRISPT